jgi:hypothetical protein
LSDPKSVAAGIGKICASKLSMEINQMDMINDPVLLPGEPTKHGVVVERLADGRIATNVPRNIIHHSPSGFEIGYGGSGPADLALNIMNVFVPPSGNDDMVKVYNNAPCSRAAFRMHQHFKQSFLQCRLDPGARLHISLDAIKAWTTTYLSHE